MYPKQLEVMAACGPSTENFILVNGPRWASKTFSALHAVCQHAWNTNYGNICLLTYTQSVGVDSGVWQQLVELFIPEWIAGNFGMKWVREPYFQNTTKKPCCEVTNRFGNKTRISLESLRVEDEVEERFKGKGYSMIWINELSKFKKYATFVALKQQLRMPHLLPHEHLFLADTNPDLDLGTKSWIYELWYEFKNADEEMLKKLRPGSDLETSRALQRQLKLIEFSVDDNLSLTAEKKSQLMADFSHDPDLVEAYFYGKWTTASADALFFKVFRPQFHVIGDIETAANKDPETLVPENNCSTLILGIDPGPVNCSSTILEKSFRTEYLSDGRSKEVAVIKVLDELVTTGEDFDLFEYVEQLVEKMEFWERIVGLPDRVQWSQWSDRSAFDMRVPFSDRYWHQHIFSASGGKISLMAAERGKGSVRARIDLFRKLLYENRLFISNRFCPKTIAMCKGIKKGHREGELIQKGNVHKHAFDSLTYAVSMELFDEMSQEVIFQLREMRGQKKGSSVVAVRM